MKKTIAILLILVIGMVGVFAEVESPADSKTKLTLTTSVDSVLESKLMKATSQLTTHDRATFVAANSDLDEEEVDIDSTHFTSTIIGYLYVMSNYQPGYTLTLDGEELESETVTDTTIKYIISAGDAVLDLVNSDNTKSKEIESLSGLTVTEYVVKVTLDETTYYLAQAADDYSADVTFTFEAN